jgi:hypothetical protein
MKPATYCFMSILLPVFHSRADLRVALDAALAGSDVFANEFNCC